MVDIEVLIELVKKYEFLYDLSHKDYKKPILKIKTWEVIGKQMNATGEFCRLKWKTVRDSYIRYKRNLKNSDGTKEIDYIWRENLKFLDHHKVNRKFYARRARHQKCETEPRVLYESTYEKPSSPPPLVPMSFSRPFQYSPNPQTNEEDPATILYPITMVLDDPTDYLLMGYSTILKKMPPERQVSMKVTLAKLFGDAELELLAEAKQFAMETSKLIPNLPVIVLPQYGAEDFLPVKRIQ